MNSFLVKQYFLFFLFFFYDNTNLLLCANTHKEYGIALCVLFCNAFETARRIGVKIAK